MRLGCNDAEGVHSYRLTSSSVQGKDGTTLFDTCADNHPSPEETCAQSELRDLLVRAIDRLPSTSRRAIRNYMNGMTAVEASEALGLPVGTIKAQLSRARAKLAKSLGRRHSHSPIAS